MSLSAVLCGKSSFRSFDAVLLSAEGCGAQQNKKGMCLMKYFVLIIFITSALSAAEKLPSEILDLSCWKITMPYADKKSGKAKEIKHPEFLSF